MTTPSAESLRLQVINRICTVLGAITAGADYWYKPAAAIQKRWLDIDACTAFPVYMVLPVPGGPIECVGPDRYDEAMEVIVKGYVKDAADPVTRLERCLRDVRKAINDDVRNGVAGSLGTLVSNFEFPASPEIEWRIDGFGGFDQRVRMTITGPFGTL